MACVQCFPTVEFADDFSRVVVDDFGISSPWTAFPSSFGGCSDRGLHFRHLLVDAVTGDCIFVICWWMQ